MMRKMVLLGCALACAQAFPGIKEELERGFLPSGAEGSSWDSVYRQVDELDAQADRGWLRLKSREEYDAYRKAMHAKMIGAIGGFPERTPLNARTVSTIRREGYVIEKVMFESMPGLIVSANLFIPDRPEFKPPYPAVVMSCGHAGAEGKDSATYQRACVHVANRGMVAFMFDPYEQGERAQFKEVGCCNAHNLIGLKAMLLGWSMPMLRIWDGIRAVDYVETRGEVDRDRIGYMGQSGGGTMSALMTAADWRLKATAPSCYLTSLGYLCKFLGPQDAEQNIFGQLAFGLNHTGYVLLPDTKVCVTGRFSDMFPWGGAAQLSRTVGDVAAMLGESGNYGLNFAPGPHGWTESTMAASADWMAAWLKGEKNLLPLDMPKYRAMDLGYSAKQVDCGIPFGESRVTPEYCTTKVEGSRDIHMILRDRLRDFQAKRARRTADETAALVKRLAVIREPAEAKVTVKTVGSVAANGMTVSRIAFMYPDGLALPAVLFEGGKADAEKPPVLMVATAGRGAFADEVKTCLARGERVMVADVTGAGEIGKGLHVFYGCTDTPEEGTAVMLYLMGESMVGRRASDILLLADWLKRRFGTAPRVCAKGSVAIAAAHAFAADRSLVVGVEISDAPPSWSKIVETPEEPVPNRYAWCVNGALVHYDWTDLLGSSVRNAIRNPDLTMPDGMGGTVGWCCRNTADSMVYGRPGKDGAVEIRFQGASRTYFSQTPLELKNGGLYRLSAEVRTSGLKGAKIQLLVWDCGWHTDWGTPAFPDDTQGAWRKVSWEGRLPTKDDPKRYTVAVAGDGGGATGENVVEIRNFALEPLDDETAAATRGLPDSGLAPLVVRIVPIEPLLAKVRAAQAKFTFYWPGEPDCGVSSCRLDGLVDGAVGRNATLGRDGRAVLDFGRLELGEHALAVRVTAPDGTVLATNDYRFTACAELPQGPSGRRLNNFVTELVRADLRDGEVRFFRPEEGWVWIAFDGTDGTSVGFVDGEASPSVRRRPDERLTEAVRWVKAGWHVLRVKGAVRGGLRIHAVKNLAMPACPLDFGPCDFSGERHRMTYPFWRRFVLPSITVANNARTLIRKSPADLDAYRERGMGVWGEIGIRFSSPLWLDAEGQWKALTDSDWGRGYDASVDESAIGAQRLQHVIFSENCWRMRAMRPHQRVNMYWGDATQNCYEDPKVHASELMAIANTGDGYGVALPETYAPVMRTPEETDRWIDLFERQTRGIAAFAPAAKAMTVFNVSPWIDLGHWSDYPHPEGDVKAMYARMLHAFATRPGFAENAGLAAGGAGAGDEETRRWLARLFRYYGLEGGTENLADAFGYRWTPGFVKNVDFDRGLDDWTAEPAEKGALCPSRIARYGVRIQRRKKVPDGVGDNVASFVTSAARANRLSQRVTGLESGRLYALHFCAPNRADVKTPSKEVPPLAFRARLEGAEELAGLRYRHMAVNAKDKAAAKEGRRIHLPIYRYVFRAKASEATLVFEDRREDGSAAPAGTEQILNYVIFRPYYVETPEEADEIAAFMRPR